MREPPNPKPISTAVAVFWKMSVSPAAPIRPRPTQNRPVTPPVRKATRSALGSWPSRAAAAVRTLPRTERFMPMIPVSPENVAPTRKAIARKSPDCPKDNATWPFVLLTTFVAVKNTSTASGRTTMPMARNCRRRNATAPSWMAAAISRMSDVP